jgi:hypothetical protein
VMSRIIACSKIGVQIVGECVATDAWDNIKQDFSIRRGKMKRWSVNPEFKNVNRNYRLYYVSEWLQAIVSVRSDICPPYRRLRLRYGVRTSMI